MARASSSVALSCIALGGAGSFDFSDEHGIYARTLPARFESIEALAWERGIDVRTAGLEVLDSLWDEVKGTES